MRRVALSIETSGLLITNNDRIVEIGAVELTGHCISERSFHYYINPGKELCPSVEDVLGFNSEYLRDKPAFGQVATELVDFVRGSHLVVYGAPFHMGFLNAELDLLEFAPLDLCIQCVEDIEKMAKIMFPDEEANLNALCARYKIGMPSHSSRSALEDARLVGQIYLAMRE
jgi:DNA polymerase-3 subunit epsilon